MGRKDGSTEGSVKSGEDRRSQPRAQVLVRVSTDSSLHPLALFTLGGYRLTTIRLNLFHHKRLNKEVHSSRPAAAMDLSLASFHSDGCSYRTLSTTYDHPSGSPSFLKRKARKRDSDSGYCSLDFFAIQLYWLRR